MVRPHGNQYATGPGPFGIAASPDGLMVVTADGGPYRFSLSILTRDDRGRSTVRQIEAPREGAEQAKQESWRSVFMGLAFEDNNRVFVSDGNSGNIRWFQLKSGKRDVLSELNRDGFSGSYSGDLAYDPRRQLLFVLDQANFRLAVIETRRGRVLSSVTVGRLPFAIALSPDGKRAYVTNVGMFEYRPVPGASLRDARQTGLTFPAFPFPSPEAAGGVQQRIGSAPVNVPGLGDPNADESNSVCVVNLEDPAAPRVERFIRTGRPIGGAVHGGSSPAGVLAAAGRVFVANSHNDSITVIESNSLKTVKEIPIRIRGFEGLRGVTPIGMAQHDPTGWLFVAEAGINAVGVIDTQTMEVLGHIPAAWYPTGIAISGDNVYVANAKGFGSGANANRVVALRQAKPVEPRGGAITAFPIPARRDLAGLTRQVMQLNGFEPVPDAVPAAYPPEIRHVVLIVKEDRSFDEVFGDVESAVNGPVDGAPMLARFGRYGSATPVEGGFGQRFSLRGISVTPNHHALAERWAISDNYYSEAETDVGGHHLLAGVFPNAWTQSTLMAAYGGHKDFRFGVTAPGRLLFPGDAAGVHPEEMPEGGDLWIHLARHGVSARNFGGGLQLAGSRRGEGMLPSGIRYLTNVPAPAALLAVTSRGYPQANTSIPDQLRADRFIAETKELYGRDGKPFPRLVVLHLPNDATGQPRPADGYPFAASYVADNDYALGRVIEYLSKSPWWRNMVVFVTEDGAFGGVDHVDAHRTVFLAAGPHVRRNYASHRNVSHAGLLKTVFRILGIPPLNLFDAAASDLSDCFTDEPDYAPYEAQPVRDELFVPERARPAEPR